jgi:hypothetical protein
LYYYWTLYLLRRAVETAIASRIFTCESNWNSITITDGFSTASAEFGTEDKA